MIAALLAATLAALAPEEAPLAVIAVDVPPAPSAELVEMTHRLRAACRERDPAVQDVRDMRATLLGERAGASLAELERAYAGALLAASHGDAAGAARTLRGIVQELERGPESAEAFEQWTRAQLRLAHVELAAGHVREYRDALERIAEVHPRLRADPDQFSPTFRRDLDAARARVALRPQHALRIAASGNTAADALTVFVDGRPVGAAPVSLQVGEGRHRIGAVAGAVRVPVVHAEVGSDGADATLDVDLAAAVHPNAGPALALPRSGRETAIVKVAAWLDAPRVVAASVATEAGATFLVGALYDARLGTLVREGRVRTTAGLASAEHLAALAAFLLTGQRSAAIVASSEARSGAVSTAAKPVALAPVTQPQPRSRPAWMPPVALGSAVAALGAGALTVQQLSAARSAGRAADALVRSDGTYVGDAGAWARHHDAATAARRNVWIGAAGTAVFAATAGVLGYLSWDGGAPVVRF